MLHTMIDANKVSSFTKAVTGIAASPGAATGIATFDVKRMQLHWVMMVRVSY